MATLIILEIEEVDLLGMHIGFRCIENTDFLKWFNNRIECKAYRLYQ